MTSEQLVREGREHAERTLLANGGDLGCSVRTRLISKCGRGTA
jgi:hypothetical protein